MKKRAIDLKAGDFVVLLENYLACVVVNWDQGERPFRSIALRNVETNITTEISVPNGLLFDCVDSQ